MYSSHLFRLFLGFTILSLASCALKVKRQAFYDGGYYTGSWWPSYRQPTENFYVNGNYVRGNMYNYYSYPTYPYYNTNYYDGRTYNNVYYGNGAYYNMYYGKKEEAVDPNEAKSPPSEESNLKKEVEAKDEQIRVLLSMVDKLQNSMTTLIDAVPKIIDLQVQQHQVERPKKRSQARKRKSSKRRSKHKGVRETNDVTEKQQKQSTTS